MVSPKGKCGRNRRASAKVLLRVEGRILSSMINNSNGKIGTEITCTECFLFYFFREPLFAHPLLLRAIPRNRSGLSISYR